MLVILPNKRTEVNRKPRKSGHNPQSERTRRNATRAADRGHRSTRLRHRERGSDDRARTLAGLPRRTRSPYCSPMTASSSASRSRCGAAVRSSTSTVTRWSVPVNANGRGVAGADGGTLLPAAGHARAADRVADRCRALDLAAADLGAVDEQVRRARRSRVGRRSASTSSCAPGRDDDARIRSRTGPCPRSWTRSAVDRRAPGTTIRRARGPSRAGRRRRRAVGHVDATRRCSCDRSRHVDRDALRDGMRRRPVDGRAAASWNGSAAALRGAASGAVVEREHVVAARPPPTRGRSSRASRSGSASARSCISDGVDARRGTAPTRRPRTARRVRARRRTS